MVPCPPPPSPSAPPPPGGGGVRACGVAAPPRPRHPDESQDPGSRAASCLALGPDFRQDDGRQDDGGWFGMTGGRRVTGGSHGGSVPEPSRSSPAGRQRVADDRRYLARVPVRLDVGATAVSWSVRLWFRVRPLRRLRRHLPLAGEECGRAGSQLLPRSVILTKVRTQGLGRCPAWLWVLTFVRMTGVRMTGVRMTSVRKTGGGGAG